MGAGPVQYTQLATLNPQAPITKYDTELRRQAIPRDIYTNLRGEGIIYRGGEQLSIPNGIYTKISSAVRSNANNIRLVFKFPVNANPLRGNTVAMGTEIVPVIRSATLYRNNYRIVVQDTPGYGEHKLDAAPYGLYEQHVKDLAPHAQAYEGLETRMSLIERNAWNLQFGSTLATCPAEWSPNFFVVNCPMANQPAFHPTLATYTNRIVTAIDRAAGGNGTGNSGFVQNAAQMLSGNAIDNILRWAFRRRMMPLFLAGRSAYMLTISQLQAQRFSDPAFVDSMGGRWVAYNRITNEKVQNWYGMLGIYHSAVGADVYIVVDDRLATLLASGSAAPFGLQAGYMWPTDVDLRNLENPLVRDACILHGAGAIVNWEAEKLHMIKQPWDYEVRNGAGYAGVRGIQQLQFDSSPIGPTGLTRIYSGSAVIVCGRSEP